jgi:carboxypeptidase C (cathepsin A)
VLNFQTISFDDENFQSAAHYLPSYTAVAWYHKKLPALHQQKELSVLLKEVEAFVEKTYITALYSGSRLNNTEKSVLAKKLSDYTGLSEEFLLQSKLTVPPGHFFTELLREEGKALGRFDGRYTVVRPEASGQYASFDPSYTHIYASISETMNSYLREDLKYTESKPYKILSNVHPWNFDKNRFSKTSDRLASAMSENPFMKIYVGSGYYDLATPYFAADFTMSQLDINDEVRKNIETYYYPAGHMMYLEKTSLKQQSEDLKAFIRKSLAK